MMKVGNDEYIEITADMEAESTGIRAVLYALDKVEQIVAKKHLLRGDSWLSTVSTEMMMQLLHNKAHRVMELYGQDLNDEMRLANVVDELQDIIAYAAFQFYLIHVMGHREVRKPFVKEGTQ